MLLLIANDAPLGPEWRDHPLKGEWAGYRECHVGGDFLLIYALDETAGKTGAIVFARAGTHAELFREQVPVGSRTAPAPIPRSTGLIFRANPIAGGRAGR